MLLTLLTVLIAGDPGRVSRWYWNLDRGGAAQGPGAMTHDGRGTVAKVSPRFDYDRAPHKLQVIDSPLQGEAAACAAAEHRNALHH